MASRVDGMSTLFTALEPSQPTGTSSAAVNPSSARRDSRGFADHLQQASQPKPSSADSRSAAASAPAASAPSRSESKKAESHRKSSSSEANAKRADADANRSAAPTDGEQTKYEDVTADKAPATDETDADVAPTDNVEADQKDETDQETGETVAVAALQAAQVVVPEVIVAPQAELAVHTELATAGDAAPQAPTPTAPTAQDSPKVEPAANGKVPEAQPAQPTATVVTVEAQVSQTKVIAQATAAASATESQNVQSTIEAAAAAQVTEAVKGPVDPANPTAQAQPVVAKLAADQDGEARKDDDSGATSEAALQNDVTQVVATTATAAAAATSTTVVSAITSTSNSNDGPKSSDDQEATPPETTAIDTSVGQDRPISADNAIPRHARLAIDKLTPHAGKIDETSNLTEAERVRFVQRVANAIHNAAETGGPIRLRLTPPELGAVRIEMRVIEGQMSVRMEAETPQAQSALLDNLPVLRERLEAQDIKIAKFDVDLFGGSNSNLSQSPQRDPNQDGPLPRHQLRRDGATLEVPEPTSSVSRPAVANDGRLNVLI